MACQLQSGTNACSKCFTSEPEPTAATGTPDTANITDTTDTTDTVAGSFGASFT
jgi:hypothetical protein